MFVSSGRTKVLHEQHQQLKSALTVTLAFPHVVQKTPVFAVGQKDIETSGEYGIKSGRTEPVVVTPMIPLGSRTVSL